MKDSVKEKFTNEIFKTTMEFKSTQQLKQRLSNVVSKYVDKEYFELTSKICVHHKGVLKEKGKHLCPSTMTKDGIKHK